MRIIELSLSEYLLLQLIEGKEWEFENAIEPGVGLKLKLEPLDLEVLEEKVREVRRRKSIYG